MMLRSKCDFVIIFGCLYSFLAFGTNLEANELRFISILDTSCTSGLIEPPEIENAALSIRYTRQIKHGKRYLVANYRCQHGYKFLNNVSRLFCSRGKWIGARPICYKQIDLPQLDEPTRSGGLCPKHLAANCQQDCMLNDDGTHRCACFSGFQMINNTCQDIDECQQPDVCDQNCINLLGTHLCACGAGYRLLPDGKTCEDVNECLLRNGHGPCQDVCMNTKGAYRCSCSLIGTRLSLDGHTCDDLDECTDNKAGCSHECINTHGQAYCACPEGMELGSDWKTCKERAVSDQPADDDYNENEDYEEENEDDYEENENRYDADYKEEDYDNEDYKDENDKGRGDINNEVYTVEDHDEENNAETDKYYYNKHKVHKFESNPPIDNIKSVNTGDYDDEDENDDDYDNKSNHNYDKHINTNKNDETLPKHAESDKTSTLPNEYKETDHHQTDDYDDEDENEDDYDNESNVNQNYDVKHIITNENDETLPKHAEGDKTSTLPKVYKEIEHHNTDDYDGEDENEDDYDDESNVNQNFESKHIITNKNNRTSPEHVESDKTSTLPNNNKETDHTTESIRPIINENSEKYEESYTTIRNYQVTTTKTEIETIAYDNDNEDDGEYTEEAEITTQYNSPTEKRIEVTSESTNQIDDNEDDEFYIIEKETTTIESDTITPIVYSTTTKMINESVHQTEDTIITTIKDDDVEDDYDDESNENDVILNKDICRSGFQLNEANECADINECESPENGCSDFCENTPGSYKCTCPDGYQTLPNDKYTCHDVNECIESNPCSHQCENTLGSYTCLCPESFVLFNDTCKENRCTHTSIIANNDIICTCLDGYNLSDDGFSCIDHNECDSNPCEHDCLNTNGSYECRCKLGFQSLHDGRCEDIDECEDDKCEHRCVNTPGSFYCTCFDGYKLNKNAATCDDVNECLDSNGNCSHFCANLDGGYQCECDVGYQLTADNRTCEEIDACSDENGNCSHKCVSIKGEAFCECPDDHELDDTNKQCVKINPCDVNNGGCSHICELINETVVCSCPENHMAANSTHCEFNACFELNGGCSHLCKSHDNLAHCFCPDDTYELINLTCYKINLCLTDNGGCSHKCDFINNTIQCSCPENHILTDKHCEKRNPCEIGNGGCSHFCNFVDDEIICECPTDYKLNGKHCEKIDLCLVNNGGCSHECVLDDDGGVECLCPINYNLAVDKKTCKVSNPCWENNGGCSHFCVNQRGVPKCYCPFNYELVNNNCVKIDGCLESNGDCSHICTNDNGRAKCSCPDGFQLINDNLCLDACDNLNCDYGCFKGQCKCPPKYVMRENTCVLDDPCMDANCSHICVIEYGRAVCKCPERMELIGNRCQKVNPCLINNGGCSHDCHYLFGQAKCSCPDGYKLHGKNCFEINPCLRNNGGCSHVCINNKGIRRCECPDGYILRPNKRTCKDINECAFSNGGCSHICKNTPGSSYCDCPYGFKLRDDNNKTCIAHGCNVNNGGCSQICKNHEYGIKCTCYNGYTLDSDHKTCTIKAVNDCPIRTPPNAKIKCANAAINGYVRAGTVCDINCIDGYHLIGESKQICLNNGNWDVNGTYCVRKFCPKLNNIDKGRFIPPSCTTKGSYPGESCKLYCYRGYKPTVNIVTCGLSNLWSPNPEKAVCTNYAPKPYIRCPSDGRLTFTLPPSQSTMLIKIPKPDSNVDWWTYVKSEPKWGMQLSATLPPGHFEVTYTAYTPYLNSSSSCKLTINIKDDEPPKMYDCPRSFEVTLNNNQFTKQVYWIEPYFEDNVGVQHVYKSKEPGTIFGIGQYHINYVASDNAGNKAICNFKLSVRDYINPGIARYRAVLICPHGVQYMSKPPDNYDNTLTTQQGCHWSHIRVKDSPQQSRYKIPIVQQRYSYQDKSYGGDNSIAYYKKIQAMRANTKPFRWYHNCC